jgi:hypothetical protein
MHMSIPYERSQSDEWRLDNGLLVRDTEGPARPTAAVQPGCAAQVHGPIEAVVSVRRRLGRFRA